MSSSDTPIPLHTESIVKEPAILKRKREEMGAFSGRTVRYKSELLPLASAVADTLKRPRDAPADRATLGQDISTILELRESTDDPTAKKLGALLKRKGNDLTPGNVVTCLLKAAERHILSDIRHGIPVATDDVQALQEEYVGPSSLFSDASLSRRMRAIQNKAIIEQEIVRLQDGARESPHIVEKMFLEALGEGMTNKVSEEKVRDAQIAALRDLQHHRPGRFDPHELLTGKRIAEAKLTARLTAYGCREEMVRDCVGAVRDIITTWQDIERIYFPLLNPPPDAADILGPTIDGLLAALKDGDRVTPEGAIAYLFECTNAIFSHLLENREEKMSYQLKRMEVELLSGIREGRVRVGSDTSALMKKYLGSSEVFSQDAAVVKAIETIQNRAIIEQEIGNLQKNIAPKQHPVKKMILGQIAERCPNPPSWDERKNAQIAALRELQQRADQFQPRDLLEGGTLSRTKLGAELATYGLKEETVENCINGITDVISECQKLEKQFTTQKQLEQLPPLARKKIIQTEMHPMAVRALLPSIQKVLLNYAPSEFALLVSYLKQISIRIEEPSSSASYASKFAQFLKRWVPGLRKDRIEEPSSSALYAPIFAQFLKRWAPCLRKEMIQGFPDPGEVLGTGVCHALANKWIIQKMKKQQLADVGTFLKELSIDSIESRDRFNQVFIDSAKQVARERKIPPQEAAKWEKTLFGLNNIVYLKTRMGIIDPNSTKNRQVDAIAQLFNEEDEIIQKHGGIVRLSFRSPGKGHAICVHCQPDTHTFHVIDPNFGFFELSSREEFFDCLADLALSYKWPRDIALACLEPKA